MKVNAKARKLSSILQCSFVASTALASSITWHSRTSVMMFLQSKEPHTELLVCLVPCFLMSYILCLPSLLPGSIVYLLCT